MTTSPVSSSSSLPPPPPSTATPTPLPVMSVRVPLSIQAKALDGLGDPSLFLNRELSWLAFNERVLDQARDPGWPLLERVKFLAIFASNLDEFFMIRVSGLHEQLEMPSVEPTADGLTTREQLARIGEIVRRLVAIASDLFENELVPALAAAGIRIRTWSQLEPHQRREAREYFRASVFPLLTPLAVDPVHPFPFLSNLSLSLAVEAEDPATGERRFARVKVPESLPRFLPAATFAGNDGSAAAGGVLDFLPLEELIAANLGDLFPGFTMLGCYPFRITRDMDLEVLDKASDLLEVVDREVQRRRFGAAVRMEIIPDVPLHIRKLLCERLAIDNDDVYESRAPIGLSGLFGLVAIARPELHDAPLPLRPLPRWTSGNDPFGVIAAGDVLVHHPYDSFTPVLEFLRRAAEDPDVVAVKMTLYRAGKNSETVRALVRAAEKGKQVAVSIELKARFDEENNIGWARALERVGVHVFYGAAGLKTHAKVLMVVRREGTGGTALRRYVHVSTGNYNASTAKMYTDLGLFTADPALGEDVSALFNSLSGFSKKPNYQRLAVAPITLRETIMAKIDEQAQRAREGGTGVIRAKVNSLVDTDVIRALYRASRAGVKIELIVRGICCLRPGVPGVSDTIAVRSVIGRFLEHARVFVFGAPGEDQMYIASADWMPRNLDRRVETMIPILDPAVKAQILRESLDGIARDNCRVYEMGESGVYQRRAPAPGEEAVDVQLLPFGTG